MIDTEFRKNLEEYLLEMEEEETLILDDPAYDNSIIGITENNELVYSYEKMIDEIMIDDQCPVDEAVEFIEYNTMRALPYIKGKKPIIMRYLPVERGAKLIDYEEKLVPQSN